MFNIADIIVIAMVALAGFLGYKNGFIKTGFGFLSFFIAVAITFVLYRPVMGLVKKHTGFEPWLTEYLMKLDLKEEEKNTDIDEKDSQEETKSEGESYIQNLPNTIVEVVGLNEMKEKAKNAIVEKIVDFALKLLSIVSVYIVTRIALWIIVLVLDLIAKLPVLKQCNEVLGLITGILLAFIRIYAILMVVALLSSMPIANGLVTMINQSFIVSFLYNNNILLKILF